MKKKMLSVRKAMEEVDNATCMLETKDTTVPSDMLTGEQLRRLLSDLISSSADLNVRIWLDGVYTDIENAGSYGQWMKGREVYFKVEGRVDGQYGVGEPR